MIGVDDLNWWGLKLMKLHLVVFPELGGSLYLSDSDNEGVLL